MGIKFRHKGYSGGRGDDPHGVTTPASDPIRDHIERRENKILDEKGVLTGDDIAHLARLEKNLRGGK